MTALTSYMECGFYAGCPRLTTTKIRRYLGRRRGGCTAHGIYKATTRSWILCTLKTGSPSSLGSWSGTTLSNFSPWRISWRSGNYTGRNYSSLEKNWRRPETCSEAIFWFWRGRTICVRTSNWPPATAGNRRYRTTKGEGDLAGGYAKGVHQATTPGETYVRTITAYYAYATNGSVTNIAG